MVFLYICEECKKYLDNQISPCIIINFSNDNINRPNCPYGGGGRFKKLQEHEFKNKIKEYDGSFLLNTNRNII